MASKKNTAAASAADPQAEQQPQVAPAPVRRYFAGGGHIPELNLFVGSGQVLAEQQPDGTWRLVQEEDAPAGDETPAAEVSPAGAANTLQDQESPSPGLASEPAVEPDPVAAADAPAE